MRLILQGQFKGFNGHTHSVDIYDTTLTSGGTPIALTLRGQGYEIDWNANISQVVTSGIIQSSACIYIQNINNRLNSFLNLLATSGENRFIIEIKRGNASFWKGVILQDFGGVEDKPESLVTLQATDGVGILLSKEMPDLSVDFEKVSLIQTIINGLILIPTQELFLTVDVFAKVRTDWFNDLIPDNTAKDPLDYVSVLNSDGSSLWIIKTTREGYNGGEVIDESPMNYRDVIEHILTRFNAIMVMNKGVWYIVQRDLWESETMRYFRYTKTGTTSGLTALEDTVKSIDDNMYRADGSFLSLPGLKSVEATYLANFENYFGVSNLLPSSFTVGSSHTTHPLITGTDNYLDISINFKDVFDTSSVVTLFKCRAKYTLTVQCGSYYLYLDTATNTHKWRLQVSTISVLSAPMTNIDNQYWYPTITATVLWRRITEDLPEDASIEISLVYDSVISLIYLDPAYPIETLVPTRLSPPNVTKIVANTFLLYILNNQTPTATAKFIAENTNTNYSLEHTLDDSMFGSAGIGGCMGLIYTYDGSDWVWSLETASQKWAKGFTTTPRTQFFNQLLVDEVQANQSNNLLVFTGLVIDRNPDSQLFISHCIKLEYKGFDYLLFPNFIRYTARTEQWNGDWIEQKRTIQSAITSEITSINEFIRRPIDFTAEEKQNFDEISSLVTDTGLTMPHRKVIPTPTKGRSIFTIKTNGQAILKKSTGEEVLLSQERTNTPIYGALYNWYAATNIKGFVNPLDTFTVPTEAQFQTLSDYLGGDLVAGGRLKSTRVEPENQPRWDSTNTGATNDVGFSMLGGGYRTDLGVGLDFFNLGIDGTILLSSEVDANNSRIAVISNNSIIVVLQNITKLTGQSIRLVRAATVDEQTLDDGAIVDNYIQNDGNEIICVKIGTQVWTAENSTETKYADNTTIPIITDDTLWLNDTTGAMCYYENDIDNAFTTFPEIIDVYEKLKDYLSAGENVTIDFDDSTETITISAQTSDESYWEYVDSLLTHIQPKDTSSGQAKIYIEHIDPTATTAATPTDTDYFTFFRSAYTWFKVTGANLKAYLKTYFDNQYLQLDQTTPQTIENGIPLLDATNGDFDNDLQLVNVGYVERQITSIGARFYMYDDNSGTEDYKLCQITPSTDAEATDSHLTVVDNEYLRGWISPMMGLPTKLITGVYNWVIFAQQTGGTGKKDLRLYWELIEYKADTSEVVIATSNNSNIITNTKARYEMFLTLATDYEIASDSYVAGKLYADVSGAGGDPSVSLFYEGTSDSHWEIPTNIEVLQDTFALKDLSNVDISGLNEETTPEAGMKMFIQLTDGTVKQIDYDDVGGGGGHKILDRDGTPLEQKDNLKFEQEVVNAGDDTVVKAKSKTYVFGAEYDNGNSGASKTIDWNNGQRQKLTLTDDCTLTFTDIAGANNTYVVLLRIIQDGTGGWNLLFPAGTVFPNGAFTFTTGGANEKCLLAIAFNGTTYEVINSLYYA